MDHKQLVAAMSEPTFYDHPVEEVRFLQTHISSVFLTGDFVYKLKKPVNFGFLDFSTIELRKLYCHAEVELNSRLAPSVYLRAAPITLEKELEVKGRNLAQGVPRSFTLNSNEILEALQEPLQGIVGAVKEALEQTPPELGADVADRGIVLTGGGALLRDLDKLLMEETGLPVVIADDPMTCVARGGGRVIELIDEHGPAVFGLE